MNELDLQIKAALIKMHVYERDHNRVSYTHTKEMLQMIFELAPVDEKDLKSMLRISSGIDKRYINQYLDGFRIWGVIFREDGMIYTEKPKMIDVEVVNTTCRDKPRIKVCPKNENKAMDGECTIEKCKNCNGDK